MENRKKVFFFGIVLLVILVALLAMLNSSKSADSGKPGKYDTFAQCIKDSGATFYGTFWCPHCQNQKKMFGSSAKLLPYVECSTADAKGQTQICIDKNITGYPTWEFADGTRLSGEVELKTLSEKTSCPLPQE
jgi:thiol-disulfide isomerase/thioredoxin